MSSSEVETPWATFIKRHKVSQEQQALFLEYLSLLGLDYSHLPLSSLRYYYRKGNG